MNLVTPEDIPRPGDLPDDLMLVYKTCLEMELFCEDKKGIGLAAVQVGIPWRLFAVKEGETYEYYVDCQYEPIGKERAVSLERCLTLPDYYKVMRYLKIRFFGKQLVANEKPELITVDKAVDGQRAVVLQHETDHCFGVLISDLGKRIDLY